MPRKVSIGVFLALFFFYRNFNVLYVFNSHENKQGSITIIGAENVDVIDS